MSAIDTVKGWINNWLGRDLYTDAATRARLEHLAQLSDYYDGIQKHQLTVKGGKFNDNLTINLVGLIVDKSVSALVGDPSEGHGLTWTFESEQGDTKPPQIEWLDEQWEANKRDIFIHKNAQSGAESGMPAIKFVPDGAGNVRLINMNPLILHVETDPSDVDTITKYLIQYTVPVNGKDVTYRQTTVPGATQQANEDESVTELPASWIITNERREGGGKWETVSTRTWEYPFPDILLWQNLPATDTPYGVSDIERVMHIQDRYNFLVSNISKIVRLFAHPQRFAKNLSAHMTVNPRTGESEFLMGPDDMPSFQGDGEILQLPPVGDLPGAMQFLQSLRQSAFDLSREVDTTSIKDKVGQITNFAVRLLYKDMLEKLGTKRMLYGEAYRELNRRMLVLGGFEPEDCKVNWPNPLPENEVEETTALKSDLEMQIVSKETVSVKRGYDWKQETERMQAEQAGSQNVGARLLSNFFNKGQMSEQDMLAANMGTAIPVALNQPGQFKKG